MRDHREIINECCADVNCEGIIEIAESAIGKALKEYNDEIVETLQNASNLYTVIDGNYVIQKMDLDHIIADLEYNTKFKLYE